MYPYIQIGSVSLYSYGLMLAISYTVAGYFFMQELKRKKLGADIGMMMTLIAIVAGVGGARLLSLFENWSAFLNDPIGMAFSSAGGQTFYGGLLLALAVTFLYLRHRKVRFLLVMDGLAPSLMIAYGIARIGCHLAGDGDYGYPTTLPWGTDYSQGIYPPSEAFRDIPEIASLYSEGIVPDHTLIHPTPVYEFLLCTLLFLILWNIRKVIQTEGKLLMLYLVFTGLERFFIEFFRISPRIALGLTGAQMISVILVIAGVIGWKILAARSARIDATGDTRAL